MNSKRERSKSYPLTKRQMSYDRTLFNREMFNKAYNLSTSSSSSDHLEISTSTYPRIQTPPSSPTIPIPPTASPIEMVSTTSVSTSTSTIFDEPYSFTGLSSPNLPPRKFITTNSSADGLLAPPSIDDQNRSRKRNNSPFSRDSGKEITEDFLFGDELSL